MSLAAGLVGEARQSQVGKRYKARSKDVDWQNPTHLFRIESNRIEFNSIGPKTKGKKERNESAAALGMDSLIF